MNPATPPLGASSPKVALNTVLGGVLGLLAAAGIAYTLRRLDDTIKTPDDVESVTGLPLLGMIVRMPGDKGRPLQYRLATLLYPRSPAAEGFRQVRTNVEFAIGDTPLRSLLIASAVPGEGKTVTASNLAVAFAQAGRTTCLMDADLRRPTIHDLFGLTNDHGLSTLMQGDEATYETATHETDVPGLRVLTTGPLPPNPAELLASPRMRAILDELLENVDLVVIDSPPLQAVTDAAILSSLADGTVLVAGAGRTRRASLLRGRDALQRVGANVLGVMLNGVSEGMDSGGAFAYLRLLRHRGFDGGRARGGADRGLLVTAPSLEQAGHLREHRTAPAHRGRERFRRELGDPWFRPASPAPAGGTTASPPDEASAASPVEDGPKPRPRRPRSEGRKPTSA